MSALATTDTPLVEVLDPDLAERIGTAFGHRTVGDLLHTLTGKAAVVNAAV